MDKAMVAGYSRQDFEVIRKDAKQKFEERKQDWTEYLLWTLPHRAKHLINPNADKVVGYPIIDGTHVLAHRSFVAGFLEGCYPPDYILGGVVWEVSLMTAIQKPIIGSDGWHEWQLQFQGVGN